MNILPKMKVDLFRSCAKWWFSSSVLIYSKGNHKWKFDEPKKYINNEVPLRSVYGWEKSRQILCGRVDSEYPEDHWSNSSSVVYFAEYCV